MVYGLRLFGPSKARMGEIQQGTCNWKPPGSAGGSTGGLVLPRIHVGSGWTASRRGSRSPGRAARCQRVGGLAGEWWSTGLVNRLCEFARRRHACPPVLCTARVGRCVSLRRSRSQVTQPGQAVARSSARPAHVEVQRSAAQLNLDDRWGGCG